MIIKHFIIQLMHNIEYADTIKIVKYLKYLKDAQIYNSQIQSELL